MCFLLSELEKLVLPEDYGPGYCSSLDCYPHVCVLISLAKGPKLGYEKLWSLFQENKAEENSSSTLTGILICGPENLEI